MVTSSCPDRADEGAVPLGGAEDLELGGLAAVLPGEAGGREPG